MCKKTIKELEAPVIGNRHSSYGQLTAVWKIFL